MKKIIFIIICLSSISCLQAQNLPISIAYYGESAIHPGLKVGVEYSLFENEKSKNRWMAKRQDRLGPRVKKRELVLSGNVGFYNHPNNHAALFLNSELSWRRTKMRKGQMLGVFVGTGYLHRFYNIDTYQLGTDGTPNQISAAGQPMWTTSLGLSFGRDLSIKRDIPMAWYIKPSAILLTPYSHSASITTALEVGVIYNFSTN